MAGWLLVTALVRARGRLRRLLRGPGPAIWFTPDRPHPRYLLRAAASWGGMRLARSAELADAAVFFEDATRSTAPVPPPTLPALNFGCADIAKTRVGEVFEAVFGYPLIVDPRLHHGPVVEKSEANGAHDGRIVACPREPTPGKCHQRLVDNLDGDGLAVDLRTHCVGRRPVLVTVKRRAAAARFLPPNLHARLRLPEELFSAAELLLISAFLERMEADWCGLDVMRDRDGRLYIVDVNKTDAGPIAALPLRDRLRTIAVLSAELTAFIEGERH